MTTVAAIFAILSSLGFSAYAISLLRRARALAALVEDFADRFGDQLDALTAEADGVLPAEGE